MTGAGPIGLGVGLLAAGGYALYRRNAIKAQQVTDELAEKVKNSADQFQKLSSALGDATNLSQQYQQALKDGDVVAQESIKTKLRQTIAEAQSLSGFQVRDQDITDILAGNTKALQKLQEQVKNKRNIEAFAESIFTVLNAGKDIDLTDAKDLSNLEAGINGVVNSFGALGNNLQNLKDQADFFQEQFSVAENARQATGKLPPNGILNRVANITVDTIFDQFTGVDSTKLAQGLVANLAQQAKNLGISDQDANLIQKAAENLIETCDRDWETPVN